MKEIGERGLCAHQATLMMPHEHAMSITTTYANITLHLNVENKKNRIKDTNEYLFGRKNVVKM